MSEYKRNIIPMNQKVERKYVARLSEDILINYIRQVVDSNPNSKFDGIRSEIREYDRLKAKSLLKEVESGASK